MEIRKILCWVLFISVVVLMMPYVNSVWAGDELLQNGFVKSVDIERRTVTIDVRSSSCRGIRQFRVEKPSAFEDLIGIRIEFFIDSSTCNRDEVLTVSSYWRVKQ